MPAATEAVAPTKFLDVFAIDAQKPSARARPRFALHRTDLNVLDGRAATIAGALRPRIGRAVVVLDALHGKRWLPIARAKTGARGRFRLRYVPHRLGSWDVQLHVKANETTSSSTRRIGRLGSYTATVASWYGGGGETACGSYLTSETMGVANKTLPCGTPVTLRYDGRTVTVPVIDRGPYVEGREFDLTEATKRALDFEGVAEVWATA
jgi:hypothetical protein